MPVDTADAVVDAVAVEVLHARVDRLWSLPVGSASLADLDALAPDLNALVGWTASLRSQFAGRRAAIAEAAFDAGAPLDDHGDPEGAHQRNSKQSRRASAKDLERERTMQAFPALRDGLVGSLFGVEHIDVVTTVLRDLNAQQQVLLRDRDRDIAVLAAAHPPEQFRVALRRLLATLIHDDGVRRFERQRRNTKLKAWTDRETGMVKVFGEFDPERGAILLHKLQQALDAMHALPAPDGCPDDPTMRNDHLRALALLQLLQTGAVGEHGPDRADVDLVVIVDHDTLCRGVHDHTIIDAGPGIELPVDTLRRMACCANIIPAVLGTDGVILDLGRQTRLANRAQRRALRAMYPTCAITGCVTRFEHCKIHHIIWWTRDGGRTDIANLVPLCSRHHHFVHEGGWQLTLDPTTRVLTVRYPAGDTVVMPPPRAGWNRDAAPQRTHPEPEPEPPPDLTLWAS